MKVQIKSKQDYGTHIDEVTEEIECELKKNNELIELKNDILHIIIEENKIVQNRYGNNITVEYQKENECEYITEYGTFKMKTKGISIQKSEKQIIAKYEIEIGGQRYLNEIEINLWNSYLCLNILESPKMATITI